MWEKIKNVEIYDEKNVEYELYFELEIKNMMICGIIYHIDVE